MGEFLLQIRGEEYKGGGWENQCQTRYFLPPQS